MGDLRLPRLLGDYAVLQRGKDIHIWGWDLPGRTVSISLAREEADRKLRKAEEDSKQAAKLNLFRVSSHVNTVIASAAQFCPHYCV